MLKSFIKFINNTVQNIWNKNFRLKIERQM